MAKPSITAVLGSYGAASLPDSGGWRAMRCPFHGDDRHASASVNADEGVFVCHACYIKGDAYAVVMAADGIGFPEAKQRVSEITGSDYQAPGQAGVRALRPSRLPAWTRSRRRRKVLA